MNNWSWLKYVFFSIKVFWQRVVFFYTPSKINEAIWRMRWMLMQLFPAALRFMWAVRSLTQIKNKKNPPSQVAVCTRQTLVRANHQILRFFLVPFFLLQLTNPRLTLYGRLAYQIEYRLQSVELWVLEILFELEFFWNSLIFSHLFVSFIFQLMSFIEFLTFPCSYFDEKL